MDLCITLTHCLNFYLYIYLIVFRFSSSFSRRSQLVSGVHFHGRSRCLSQGSVASVRDDTLIDRPSGDIQDISSAAGEFTGPVDEILGLIQNIYDKRLKLSAKDMQLIDSKVHEMKNRIINALLRDASDNTKKCQHSFPPQNAISNLNANEWPSFQKIRHDPLY